MDSQCVGVKLFCRSGMDLPLVDFIPVFHRWIQTHSVKGLLIDVADYSHVPEGPGIILVAHEGIYALDEARGRRGLAFQGRRPPGGDFDQRLSWVVSAAVGACSRLEDDTAGKVTFGGDELEVFVNDRLHAPNDESTLTALRPHIDRLAGRLYPGMKYDLTGNDDARLPFSVAVKPSSHVAFSDVVGRLEG